MNNLCECGCGRETKIHRDTKNPNRFIHGHANKGKKASLETRKKLSNSHTGKTFSSEHIAELSRSHLAEAVKEKVRKTNLERRGVGSPMQSKEVRENHKRSCLDNLGVESPLQSEDVKTKHRKTTVERYGDENWAKSPQGRLAARVNRIRTIEIQMLNGEPLMPCIGILERLCLDSLQDYTKYTIIRNDKSFKGIIGRFPDGHIPELKLFIQFDERHHFTDSEMTLYKKDDVRCTKDLESVPGYRVFRVSERAWKENREKVIGDFQTVIRWETGQCSSH